MKKQTETKELRRRVVELEKGEAERKRAEEQVLVANERLQYLLSASSAVIYTSNTSGNYGATFISNNVIDMAGYEAHDYLDDPRFWIDHIHPDDINMILGELPRIFDKGLHSYDYRFQHKDGRYIWVRDEMKLVRNAKSEPIEIIGFWTDITDRKRAEEELRASEEKIRNLFQSVVDAIVFSDLEGHIIDENEAALRIQGYSRLEEVIGKSGFDFIAEEDRARAIQSGMKTAEEGYGYISDVKFVSKDGRECITEATASLVRDDCGNPIGFVSVTRDITDRKRAEQALRESEEKYRLLAENVADVLWTMDMNLQITYISPSITRQTGYSVEEGMALGMGKSMTPASYEVAVKTILKAMSEEQKEEKDLYRKWTVELEMCCKDGSTIWNEMETGFIRNAEGKAVGIIGVARDITERKRAEEEKLQAITERAAVIDAMGDGLMTIGMDGKILSINPAFERLCGYTKDEFTGKDAAHFIPRLIKPEDQERLSDNVGAALKGDSPENAIFSLLSRDGQEIPISVTASFISDAEGKPATLIATFKDITDIKRAEEELKRHREHLEELVEERTNHLVEKSQELSELNLLLEEANRHKSEFLANMSHELRTPLNSIIGYTKLILDGVKGKIKEEQRKDLTIVHSSSQHLLQMINDLLDISKIEAGRVELRWQEFSVSDLLAEAVPPIQRLAEEKGLTLAYDVGAGIDKLYADKGRVRQVLLNILWNAVKFTGEGGIDLRVSESETDFTFSVADTGMGIREDDLEIIFDSFEQVGPSKISGYEGTGLGLAISKQFVEMHGGMIWANSEPGKGSTFTFTLPKKGAD